MKKILLICSAGMSTSLLVTKMEKAAKEKSIEVEISATGSGVYKTEAAKADVILLGPQVRFMLKEVSTAIPNKPIAIIDMRSYGKVDGAAVLNQAMKLLD
ncbi:MAG: PTS sugar transporter subunit IIB [Sarcina sp.]